MEHGQTLAQAARSGATLTGEFVVDCHMHNARVAKFFSRIEHYRDLITQMNRIGVTCGVVSNLWTTGEHWQAYPEMLAMCETYPGRFWGYLAPDPHRDDHRTEMEKFAACPCFRGVKLHPVEHKMDFECPEYQYVYAWAGEREFPVLLHTWGQEVLRFHKLAQSFPEGRKTRRAAPLRWRPATRTFIWTRPAAMCGTARWRLWRGARAPARCCMARTPIGTLWRPQWAAFCWLS